MSELGKEQLENILVMTLVAAKNMTLYPPEHPMVQKPITRAFEALSELLRLQGILTLGIVEEVLVFEGIPFYGSNQAIKEMQARFQERDVHALELHDGLTFQEFSEFVKLLIEDPVSLKNRGTLPSVFAARAIEHIRSKDVKEVYHNAIDAVGEVLSQTRLGRIPQAARAKAAVSDLKRMVLSERPALLALTLIKSYDNYLFNHSVNVSVLALALAHGMGVTENDMSEIGLAGILHDLGKTLTPKAIILKPGKLNDEEWLLMRQHPEKSAEIVTQMEGVSDLVARLVREHHVNFDYGGYPVMEPGKTPHPYSKIITVADCYDAITTLRPYQKPYHPREAMMIMEKLSGRVIDPKYFDEFVKVLGIYPVGSLVRLDSNEIAVVIETYPVSPLAPRVKIVFDPDGRPLPAPLELDLSRPESCPGNPRFIVSTVDPLLYNVETANLV